MFKALARFFGFKPKPSPQYQFPPAPRPTLDPATTMAARREQERGRERERTRKPEPEPEPPPPPRPAAEEVRAAAEQREIIDSTASPEAICGIDPGMTQDEIADLLARLYQRHNRASSSFDPQLQAEAEFMLDIIAGLREKYLSRPPGE